MKNKKGFTLIELVVVMAIIAILAVVLIGAILAARNTATNTTNKANANSLRIGLEAHYSRYGAYCGGTTGTMACTALAANTTFTALQTSINAAIGANSVNLGTTTANTTNAGGGRLVTAGTGSAVVLTPVDWNNVAMDTISLP